MAIQYFCDRCKKEQKEIVTLKDTITKTAYDLCSDCLIEFEKFMGIDVENKGPVIRGV